MQQLFVLFDRVLQPPGGGSSNIFTCENLSQPLDSTNRPLKEASICESLQPLSNNEPRNLSSEIKEVAMKSVANSQQPTVQPVICRSRNSGFNPITGEFSCDSVTTTKAQSSCITVRQPPGGASSGLW